MCMRTRSLTSVEIQHVDDVLQRLRQHFDEWPTDVGNEWHLIDFAFYEGCGGSNHCGELLRIAAPLALGRHLVTHHGCEWCMCSDTATDSWRFAVSHPNLDVPIDLYRLDEHPLRDPDQHDEDTAPFGPGEGAHESVYAIKRMLGEHGG